MLAPTNRIRIALAFLVALVQPAFADIEAPSTITMVPTECIAYWRAPGETATDWNRVLSFAACIQDASVEAVADAAMLPALVDRFAERLLPSLTLYASAAQNGPGPIKLRAVYQIGMAELDLMVRARLSITPALRPELEKLLAPSAAVALLSFSIIDQVVTEDPTLAPDGVTAYMVRRARELLVELRRAWPEIPVHIQLATATP